MPTTTPSTASIRQRPGHGDHACRRVNDPALAPPGQHVLSAIVQYAPYALKGGWDSGAAALQPICSTRWSATRPGLRGLDPRRRTADAGGHRAGVSHHGGHWHHGELAFDQFFMVRPVPGAAQYPTPLAGLYPVRRRLPSGRRCHGHAGRNAARQVLAAGGLT